MVKSALKLYRDNIFEVFAIIGIIAIGVLIGVLVVTPAIYGIVVNNISEVAARATSIPGVFDKNLFFVEITKHFNALDWANPIRTLKVLFEQDGLLNIIKKSLETAHFDMSNFSLILSDVQRCISGTLNGLTNQAAIFIACAGVFAIASYILTRLFIKIRSTKDHNILRFILSIILNLVLLLSIFSIMGVCLFYLTGPILYVTLVCALILMLVLSLLISILIYKNKETRFTELFNIKNLLMLFLSSLIVLGISTVLIIPILIFSELIGLLIALPLLIVSNIIIENITINFVTEYDDNKKIKIEKKIMKHKKEA